MSCLSVEFEDLVCLFPGVAISSAQSISDKRSFSPALSYIPLSLDIVPSS